MDTDERHALTVLCDVLIQLRDECARHQDRQRLLNRIETEARARRPIVALIAELIGDEDREKTLRTLGAGLPGTGPGQADEERFRCPDGACERVATTTPAGPVPRCPVTDQPMLRR